MTDNEKLIEEARQAATYPDVQPISYRLVDRLADALEAAEKALGEATVTPTDDEREALATALDDVHDECVTEGGCEFRGWITPWRPGETRRVNGAAVDPILAAFRRRSEPQGEPSDANSGVGWFEWFKMPENTTEIAYVHESGEVFDPARGWNPVEFSIAAAEGRVHRLVRAVTEQGENR